jgi:hypothetical protein
VVGSQFSEGRADLAAGTFEDLDAEIGPRDPAARRKLAELERQATERATSGRPVRPPSVGNSPTASPRFVVRVSDEEETRLMKHASPQLKLLIPVALYTGPRRGEMLALT